MLSMSAWSPSRAVWNSHTISLAAASATGRCGGVYELSRRATAQGVELAELPVTPADVVRVSALVAEGTINDKLARQVFDGVLAGEGTPDEVVDKRGLKIVSDEGELTAIVDEVIAANPDVVEKIRGGKVAAAGALVGAVMKATKGQADAGRARELILKKITG